MNLGREPEQPHVSAPSSPDMPDVVYPSFSIDGDLAEQFLEEHPLEFEDEITANVRLCVSGLERNKFGSNPRLSFDVKAIEHISKAKEDRGRDEADNEENPAVSRLMRREKAE